MGSHNPVRRSRSNGTKHSAAQPDTGAGRAIGHAGAFSVWPTFCHVVAGTAVSGTSKAIRCTFDHADLPWLDCIGRFFLIGWKGRFVVGDEGG